MKNGIIGLKLREAKSIIDRRGRHMLAEIDARLWFIRRIARVLPVWAWLSCIIVVSFISFLLVYTGRAQADSQGPNSPSSSVDCAAAGTCGTVVGTVAWGVPGNATALDSTVTSASLASNAVSHYLTVTNFGFSIPTGSTINGISAEIIEDASQLGNGTAVKDNSIKIIKAGAAGGTEMATTATWPNDTLIGLSSVTYGGSTNLWGQTWAASDLNSPNFGIGISAKNVKAGAGGTVTANVDYVDITVYYTPPPVVYNQASYRLYGNADATASATYIKGWGGSSSNEIGRDIVATSDGGYAVTGDITGAGAGNSDAFLAKFDAAGNFLWATLWGGTGADSSYSLVQTSNGGYAIAGSTSSFGAGGDDAFIAIFSTTGTLLQSHVWGGTSSDDAYGIVQTSDGGYAITGSTISYAVSSTTDLFIAKFDSSLNLSWSKTWGGTGGESGSSIVQTSDGGYAVTGNTNASGIGAGSIDAILIKYTSTGTVSWSTTWGGASNEGANAVVQTSDGGYAIAGYDSSVHGTNDTFIAKFDQSGALKWNTIWDGPSTGQGDTANDLKQTSDGGFVIVGESASFSSLSATHHALLLKYNAPANTTTAPTVQWDYAWGTTGIVANDYANAVIQNADNTYTIAGQTNTFSAGGSDAGIARYNSSGTIANCTSSCSNASGSSTTTAQSVTLNPTVTVSSPTATNSNIIPTTSSYTAGVTVGVATSPSDIDVNSSISPLAAQNTAATIPGDGQPFRLRMDIGISGYQLNPSVGLFVLQYAKMNVSCDASFTNTSNYLTVTDTSTVRYYDNPVAISGLKPKDNHLSGTVPDPTDGTNPLVYETYQEKGTYIFTNSATVPTGSDGLWDFALTTDHTLSGTHYCLRVVKSSSGALNTYTSGSIVEIITPSSTYTQSSYRLFNSGSAVNTFAKAWGGSGVDVAYDAAQTSDGGYIVTGSTSLGAGSTDMFIAKYDSSGTQSWYKVWGGVNAEIGRSIIQTADGGYAVTGSTASYGAGSTDAFVLKCSDSLCSSISWQVDWGGTGADVGYSVVQASNGNIAITGSTNSTGFTAGANDAFIAVFNNATGALIWNTAWGGTLDEVARSIIATSDGNYAITGNTLSFVTSTNNNDMFLAKFNGSTGAAIWSTNWGGLYDDWGYSIIQTSDSGYAVTGITSSFGTTSLPSNPFLAKFDSSGVSSWSRMWSSGNNNEANGIVQTADGGYVIAGGTTAFGAGAYDALTLRYDASGNFVRARTLGGSSGDELLAAALTADGGYIFAGDTSSYGTGGDILLVKTDASNNIDGCSTACSAPGSGIATSVAATTATPSPTTSSPTSTAAAPTAAFTTPASTATTVIALAHSAAVGTAITTQNQKYDDVRVGSEFRLRLDMDVSGSGVSASGQSFKLQYAVRGSDLACDTSFTGESYADVTTTTPVYYFDDPNDASGDGVHWNSNDPTSGSNILSPQTYQESNNFTNTMSTIYSGESGEWDLSLAILSGVQPGTDYCLRVVTSAGSAISYSRIVDIAYGPSMISLMRHGAWFSGSGIKQNYFLKGQ